MAEKPAVFDLFFRTNPFEGGYAVFAGLEPAWTTWKVAFYADDLAYLKGLGSSALGLSIFCATSASGAG